MIARLLVSIGIVAALVGFSFWGIATSTYQTEDDWLKIAYGLMAGGTTAAVIGWFMFRSDEGAKF